MSLLLVIIISNKWIIKALTIYITDQAAHYIGEVFVQNFILATFPITLCEYEILQFSWFSQYQKHLIVFESLDEEAH